MTFLTIFTANYVRLFADDCLIYRTIQSSGDHYILQDDFNTLTAWAKANDMEFDITKSKIIQVTTLRDKSSFIYTMNATPLQSVDHHLYLGVYIHHKLSWQPQLTTSVAKQTAFWVSFGETCKALLELYERL